MADMMGRCLAFVVLVLGLSDAVQAHTALRCDLSFSNGLRIQDVPVARTQAEKSRGLSNVRDIGPGMLFSWETTPQPVAFWMKDTYVPLSIGFFDQEGVLFSVRDMQPLTLNTHASVLPVKYALELKQGDFARQGLKIGIKLTLDCP